jgi:hypothetical protein
MTGESKEKVKRAYEMALLSQGACNLSGLVHSLAETMELLWKEANEQGKGTDLSGLAFSLPAAIPFVLLPAHLLPLSVFLACAVGIASLDLLVFVFYGRAMG